MNDHHFSPRQRLGLVIILVLYTMLGIAYALATPPLEASDEYKHYPVIQFITTRWQLPVLDPERPGLWLNEAGQPPLYYVLMAGLIAPIDTTDLATLYQRNPHAFIGDPNQVANKNLMIHDPARERFPWQGSVLAIHLIRFASIALGVGTIIVIAQLGYLLFNPQLGLIAAALTAFNPMFLFVSAAANNDSLAILLGHLGLLLLVRLWRDPGDLWGSWRRYAWLGVVIGFGTLTKISLVALLGLAGISLAALAWKHRNWRILFCGGATVATVVLAIAGWWFVRNITLYGDLTGVNAFVAVEGVRDTPITWSDWRGEFGTFFRSYWGLFGAVNIAAPESFYLLANLAAILGAVGFSLWWAKRRRPRPDGLWLLGVWGLILFGLLLQWNIIHPAFQGRLIFPALGALNVLWGIGLVGGFGTLWGKRLSYALVGLFLGAAALAPWTAIRPAYAYPRPLAAVPEEAQFGPISFRAADGEIRLVGAEVPRNQVVRPGGKPIEVKLYWQAVTPVAQDYLSTVHLLGRDLQSVGQVNRYPAEGMIPTSRWTTGEIWRDVYRVSVTPDAVAPTRLRIDVGLYDAERQVQVPALGPDGVPLELILVGEAKLASDGSVPDPPTLVRATFADGIALKGYDLAPKTTELTLYWQAREAPTADYTVFVHLVDHQGEIWGQGDGPPIDGDYPTSLWSPGEIVVDAHQLTIEENRPPGIYRLVIGLYRPDDGTRLAVWDDKGVEQSDGQLVLPDPITMQ